MKTMINRTNSLAFRLDRALARVLEKRGDEDMLAAIRQLMAKSVEDTSLLAEARQVGKDLGEQLRQTTAAMRRLQVERDDARAGWAECALLLAQCEKDKIHLLAMCTLARTYLNNTEQR